jgi:hypothetical protein
MTTRSIHRSHTRAARWLAAAAIAGLLVGGCGSAENEPTVDTPQGAVTAPDLTSPPSNVRWQDYQGIALPVADQGPDNNSGAGPVSGFALRCPRSSMARGPGRCGSPWREPRLLRHQPPTPLDHRTSGRRGTTGHHRIHDHRLHRQRSEGHHLHHFSRRLHRCIRHRRHLVG